MRDIIIESIGMYIYIHLFVYIGSLLICMYSYIILRLHQATYVLEYMSSLMSLLPIDEDKMNLEEDSTKKTSSKANILTGIIYILYVFTCIFSYIYTSIHMNLTCNIHMYLQ
jgi:hypothetical protein